MKRWIKRLSLCTGALLLLSPLLFLAVEHFRGKIALRWRLKELKAKGEIFSIASLEPGRPTPIQNAFLDLASLTNRKESILTNLNFPPSLKLAKPGKAIISGEMTQWYSDHPKRTNNWNQFGQEIEQASELLNFIATAVQKPGCDNGFQYRDGLFGSKGESLTQLRQAAELLDGAVVFDLKCGRLDDAHSNLCALIKLVEIQKSEQRVYYQAVRYVCNRMAFEATWQALQTSGWNEPQLAILQAHWESLNFPKDLEAAMQMERAMTLDFCEQIKHTTKKMEDFVDWYENLQAMIIGPEGIWQDRGFIRNVNVPLWQIAWIEQDELNMLNQWQKVIERERFVFTNSWMALSLPKTEHGGLPGIFGAPETLCDPGSYDRVRFLFSSTFSIKDTIIFKALAAQEMQNFCITAIAIYRYRHKTGSFPANLSALVPKFLSNLPRDSMDGKSLRYRLNPATGFVLYSVGSDGKDDGGDPAPSTNQEFSHYSLLDGKDAVWPVPATREETAAAILADRDKK